MKKKAFCLLFAVAFACSAFAQDVPKDTCLLKGRVCIVDNFEDLRVEIVNSFEDVELDVMESVWSQPKCGQIELVENFPDVSIRIVESFPDVRISFRDTESRERFMKFLKEHKKH